jgi:hypothetical protein
MSHAITEIRRVSGSDVNWECACGGSGRSPEARAALEMSAHLGTPAPRESVFRGDFALIASLALCLAWLTRHRGVLAVRYQDAFDHVQRKLGWTDGELAAGIEDRLAAALGTADSGPRGDGLLIQDLALCLYALGVLSERSSIRLGDRYLAALRRTRSHLGYTGKTLPGEITARLEAALPQAFTIEPADSGMTGDSASRGDSAFANMLASDIGRLLAVVNGNAMRERRLRSRTAEDALMKARRDLCIVLGVQRKDESAELIRDRVLAGLRGAAVVTGEDLRQPARSDRERNTG